MKYYIHEEIHTEVCRYNGEVYDTFKRYCIDQNKKLSSFNDGEGMGSIKRFVKYNRVKDLEFNTFEEAQKQIEILKTK